MPRSVIRVAQVSLGRLSDVKISDTKILTPLTVMCDQDEEWQASRYFSEKKMAKLYDERARTAAKTPPSPERVAELLLVAKKAIDTRPELADELEAA